MLFCVNFFIAQFIITRKTRSARITRHIRARKDPFECVSSPKTLHTTTSTTSVLYISIFHTHIYYQRTLLHFLNVIYCGMNFFVFFFLSVGDFKICFPVEWRKSLAIWLKWAYKIRLFWFKNVTTLVYFITFAMLAGGWTRIGWGKVENIIRSNNSVPAIVGKLSLIILDIHVMTAIKERQAV